MNMSMKNEQREPAEVPESIEDVLTSEYARSASYIQEWKNYCDTEYPEDDKVDELLKNCANELKAVQETHSTTTDITTIKSAFHTLSMGVYLAFSDFDKKQKESPEKI